MANDRSVRSLEALNNASSSRVLNLLALSQRQVENEEFRTNPLLQSPVLNAAIILKHRLRADETDMFDGPRAIATKVIIPFEKANLRAGGQSMFIGQRGFEELLKRVWNYGEKLDIARDLNVLQLLDAVPSLDPFLLREFLRSNGISPDGSYFEISPADQSKMFEYASREIRRLTDIATSGSGDVQGAATGRMVSALLSNEVNEKLEPLRLTLSLNEADFCEGVFSWRGFIYYKWSLEEFWPQLIRTLKHIRSIAPFGRPTSEQSAFLTFAKRAIIQGAQDSSNDVRRILAIYDDAYGSLIVKQDAKMFRQFLLNAPALFLEIGEKMGALAHISSFWQYRFPAGAPRNIDVDELTAIFEDFYKSFGLEAKLAA